MDFGTLTEWKVEMVGCDVISIKNTLLKLDLADRSSVYTYNGRISGNSAYHTNSVGYLEKIYLIIST
jgi:hypothetical protein